VIDNMVWTDSWLSRVENCNLAPRLLCGCVVAPPTPPWPLPSKTPSPPPPPLTMSRSPPLRWPSHPLDLSLHVVSFNPIAGQLSASGNGNHKLIVCPVPRSATSADESLGLSLLRHRVACITPHAPAPHPPNSPRVRDSISLAAHARNSKFP
jgi:hypothetical protein